MARDVSIWAMRRDGSQLRRLARVPKANQHNVSPTWSPDGRRIIFHREGDIWVMDADASRRRRLTSGPALDSNPAWSPDGTQVAFERNSGIYLVGGDGSGLRRLTRGLYDGQPVWQPVRR